MHTVVDGIWISAHAASALWSTSLTENQKLPPPVLWVFRRAWSLKAIRKKIRKLRKNIAELLVAQAPNSRAIQDIAVRCGVKNVRYPFRNENCVLCGGCESELMISDTMPGQCVWCSMGDG